MEESWYIWSSALGAADLDSGLAAPREGMMARSWSGSRGQARPTGGHPHQCGRSSLEYNGWSSRNDGREDV